MKPKARRKRKRRTQASIDTKERRAERRRQKQRDYLSARDVVFLRQGGSCGYRNPETGKKCKKKIDQIHHKVHRSQGGTDDVDNLIGLCRKCHDLLHGINSKGILDDETY